MPRGHVYQRGVLAGHLERDEDGVHRFTYDAAYLERADALPVSLTLPLREQPYESDVLFPFFFGLLSEGSTRALQCRTLRIDERDDFTLLLKTGLDTIGSVVIVEDDGGLPATYLEEGRDG